MYLPLVPLSRHSRPVKRRKHWLTLAMRLAKVWRWVLRHLTVAIAKDGNR
jgi:hypothetical protein